MHQISLVYEILGHCCHLVAPLVQTPAARGSKPHIRLGLHMTLLHSFITHSEKNMQSLEESYNMCDTFAHLEQALKAAINVFHLFTF